MGKSNKMWRSKVSVLERLGNNGPSLSDPESTENGSSDQEDANNKANNDSSEEEEYQNDNDDDEDHENEHDESNDSDDSEDFVSPSRGARSSTSKQRQSSRRRNVLDTDDDDDEDGDDEDNENDDDEEQSSTVIPLKRSTRSSAQKAKRTMDRISLEELEGSDQDLADSELEEMEKATSADSDHNEDDEDDDFEDSVANRRRSKRNATKRKRNTTVKTQQSTRSTRANNRKKNPASLRSKRRKSKQNDSDEDYEDESQPDTSDDDSAADNSLEFDSEDDFVLSSVDKNVMDVDEEQIGTADEDSSDEDVAPKRKSPNKKKEIRPSPRKGRFQYSDSEDSGDENEKKPRARKMGRPSLPFCPSTEDAITAEKLPKRHICYISPDGTSRQCFKIETLRHIALKSSLYNLRRDVDADRQNYLQPPHFRSAMSDELVDQIASKFGRQALDLQSPYWENRCRSCGTGLQDDNDGNESNVDDDDDEGDDYDERDDDSDEDSVDVYETFDWRLERYFKHAMGNKDPYVCPLCYWRSYEKLVSPDEESKDDGEDSSRESDDDDENTDGENNPILQSPEFLEDPMTILGCPDNDEYKVASQFCFLKVSELKVHLRNDHCVDTSGIDGNELYKAFKIRAQDGLLQRWLASSSGEARQGDMMKYWNQGGSQLFVQLVDHIGRARHFEKEQHRSDLSDYKKGLIDDFLWRGEQWFKRSSKNAQDRWLLIRSPFEKTSDNMNDFIAADDDVDEVDNVGTSHAEMTRRMEVEYSKDDPNSFVAKIERKYAEDDDEEVEFQGTDESHYDGADNEEDDASDDDDDNGRQDRYDPTQHDGAYSEVEEETDEWMTSRMNHRKRKSSTSSGGRGDSCSPPESKVVGKRLTKRRSSTTSTPQQPVRPVIRRTPAIQESSDED